MYHPISGDDDDQYVELHNRGAQAVNLAGWQLSDGISFTFPNNTVLAPDAYLVVARDINRLRSNYTILNATNSIGNFSGKLSHSGERVALRMPDTILSTNSPGDGLHELHPHRRQRSQSTRPAAAGGSGRTAAAAAWS